MASSAVAAKLRKQGKHVIREIHRRITRNLTNLNRNIELLSNARHMQGHLTVADTGQDASFRSGNGWITRLGSGQMRHVNGSTVFLNTSDQKLLNPIGSAELDESRLDMDLTEPQWFVRRDPMDYENTQPTQHTPSRLSLIEK